MTEGTYIILHILMAAACIALFIFCIVAILIGAHEATLSEDETRIKKKYGRPVQD